MGLLEMLQNDPEKRAALQQGLLSAGAAMMAGGRQDFGASLGQGLGAGVKTYQEKFEESRKKALAMKPYQAAMTPARPAVPAAYKTGGASYADRGQAELASQNGYMLTQGANPYGNGIPQDDGLSIPGMPASLQPQPMGIEDMGGGQAAPIEEQAAQPGTPASMDWGKYEDAVLQDPTNSAYQKLVESKLLPAKNEKTAEQKNFEYMMTLPEDQRQQFNKTRPASTPSTVQEWQYYSALPPEEQARFIEMKRAAQIMNLGGTQAVRATGGGIKESYAVTPKMEDMPSFKGAQATAVETAKAGVERMADASKKNRGADSLLSNITAAETILKKGDASGSLVGTGLAAAKGAVGYSDASTQDNKQLKLISGWMVSNVPRMEGPQSNYDVDNYKQMAAAVGDSTVPLKDRLSALTQLKSLQTKYKTINRGGVLSPQEILNTELEDATARGDAQNVNAIRREMQARKFRETSSPKDLPKKPVKFDSDKERRYQEWKAGR